MDSQNNNLPESDEDILVTLDMDDGTKVECEILTIFDVKGQDYFEDAIRTLEYQQKEAQKEKEQTKKPFTSTAISKMKTEIPPWKTLKATRNTKP